MTLDEWLRNQIDAKKAEFSSMSDPLRINLLAGEIQGYRLTLTKLMEEGFDD